MLPTLTLIGSEFCFLNPQIENLFYNHALDIENNTECDIVF